MDDFYFNNPEADIELAASKRKNEPAEEGQLTVDVFQTSSEIIIKSTIAGVSTDDIDISIAPEVVTIRGSRHNEEKIKESDYYHQELYWGAFSRSIILPEEIDVDSAKASIRNGLLTLHLPKLTRSKVKKLKINS
jgi:HSP20 family protein